MDTERRAYTEFSNSNWSPHIPETVMSETTTTGMEKEIQPRSLEQELAYLQLNWHKEGLPQNWADFPGAGWQMKTQMSFLTEGGTSFPNWLVETEADLKGFTREYLEKHENGNENLVFPINYTIESRGGRPRMVNTFHGGAKLLEETVSATERNGSVRETVVEVIEPFFLDAPDGSIAYMISPSGDSGMRDDEGKRILFPDSFGFIWQKRGDEVVGVSIKTDFTYKEHRAFIEKMTGRKLAEDEPIESYIRSVGLYPSDQSDIHGITKVEDVVNRMRDARFEETGGSLYAFKNQLWRDVYADIARMDDLWNVDDKTQNMITEFIDYAKKKPSDYNTLQQALAVTILRIKRLQGIRFGDGTNPQKSYGEEFEEIQAIPGCAGGGRVSTVESLIDRLAGKRRESSCINCQASECGICDNCYMREEGGLEAEV